MDMHEVWEWGLAVLEHWHGWLSGGLIAFGLELGDRIWDWKPSKKLIFAILAVGLLASLYSA
jgi:hypothetical protein